MKINSKSFKEFLKVEQERQLIMKELSETLGIDITFSDKEMVKNAEASYTKHIEKQLITELNEWMKSASF